MMTGGTPVSRMNGVAIWRSQPGAFGHAATAPSRLPMMKVRMVVTSSRPMVHGSDCAIRSDHGRGIFVQRVAEIQPDDVAQILAVLLEQRLIEAELLLHGGDELFEVGRGEAAGARQLAEAFADGVARRQARDEEDDGRGGPDDQDEKQKPADNDLEGQRN